MKFFITLDFHGKGRITFPNHDTFEGLLEHGVPDGIGKYVKADGR